ncbi:MAG: HAMP domain-containing histidine kinase [Nitrospira sp.]|nr:HAMP domain-containing histidine kinase [Nitrospira sp.]
MLSLPNTLTFRLTFWYVSAFLLCLACALLGLYLYMDNLLDRRMNEDLREDVAEFQELLRERGLDKVVAELSRESEASDESKIFLRLLDAEGYSLFSSDLSAWEDLPSITQEVMHQNRSFSGPFLRTLELSQHDVPARMIVGQIGPGLVFQAGETLEQKAVIMDMLLKVFAGMVFFGVPLSAGIGWLIARKAVSGIEAVSRAARDIERGDLGRQVRVDAREKEIQTLMETFNAMAGRIRGLIQGMREMTDNIAHDLRSPLARIRASAEGILSDYPAKEQEKAAAAETVKECDRLIHLINTTLDMAEMESGVHPEGRESVNLSALINDLCELFEAVAEQKHVMLDVAVAPDCYVRGHTAHLQRMAANLLDNAMKYTPAGGRVSVSLTRLTHECRLTISDTGIGIPSGDLQRIFDRFFRCDHSRSPMNGFGLGLCFAQTVARSHGGDIQVSSEVQKGSTFFVVLPCPEVLPSV